MGNFEIKNLEFLHPPSGKLADQYNATVNFLGQLFMKITFIICRNFDHEHEKKAAYSIKMLLNFGYE